MLRKIRTILAAVVFVLITLLFVDFTGIAHHWLSWLAKIQFLPAVLALNVGVIVALVLLTFIFGRVYCSVICPLGVFQDVLARLRRKKNKYSYSREVRWLRYPVLVLFIIALVAGVGAFFQLLAPYSAYGRIEADLQEREARQEREDRSHRTDRVTVGSSATPSKDEQDHQRH